eukprot:7391622-Prymnesium_polylepis.1
MPLRAFSEGILSETLTYTPETSGSGPAGGGGTALPTPAGRAIASTRTEEDVVGTVYGAGKKRVE